MRRIITVTFHCAHNYGAVLQAYALQRYIEKKFPNYSTACLDYRPTFLETRLIMRSNGENIIKSVVRNIIAFNSRYRRKVAFDKFIHTYIKTVPVEGLDKKENIFIVGSDQVWNKEITGQQLDSVYTLEFITKARKTSYAASIGTTDVESHKLVAQKILDFDKIGVREEKSKVLLESFGVQNVHVNLDPVFLLDKTEYESIAVNVLEEDYVLIYTLETNESVKQKVEELKCRYKTASIGTFRNLYGTDYHFSSLSPQEYLGLIRRAKYIITNSFHAIAFSIIFKKKFEYISLQNGRGIRIENLLSLINYSDKTCDNTDMWHEMLKSYIDDSKKWIQEIVEGENFEKE